MVKALDLSPSGLSPNPAECNSFASFFVTLFWCTLLTPMRDVPEISDMVPKFEETPHLVKIHVSLIVFVEQSGRPANCMETWLVEGCCPKFLI